MKNFLLFILIFITTISYSQSESESESELEFFSYLKNYQTFNVDSLINYKGFKYIKYVTKYDNYYEREIDFELREISYDLFIEGSGQYQITEIRKDGKSLGVIAKNWDSRILIHFLDTEQILKYTYQHNEFYDNFLGLSDFVDAIVNKRSYGYMCGSAPKIEKGISYDRYRFNDKNNIEVFRNWLKSWNVELQNYGLDALEYLQKTGKIKLNQEDEKIIKHIKKRNSLLNNCSGCNTGLFEKRY